MFHGFETRLPEAQVRRWATPLIATLAAALMLLITASPASAIERRKDQFPTEPSYMILPLPYSLPGIGEGFFIPVLFSNIAETTTDAYALMIVGDAEGYFFGLEEFHLVEKHVWFELTYQDLNKAVVNNYETRGMNTAKDDYSLIEVSQVDSVGSGITLSFWERRLEFFAFYHTQEIQIDRLLDIEGVPIAEFDPPYTDQSKSQIVSVELDYTDDNQDPRQGVRLNLSRIASPADDLSDPEYYRRETTLTGYIPLGEHNTFALHYFRSDAIVTRTGETDLNVIKAQIGLQCSGDATCLARETQLATSFRDANLNGTSQDLGGEQRLRAYPINRFQGAHTLYYAAEFRWNLTEEVTPFDYFIWKDVRTGIQLALFYEVGSVSETSETLGDETRDDYGVGLRMVAGSGQVYRIDAAVGDEGSELTVIIDYPF